MALPRSIFATIAACVFLAVPASAQAPSVGSVMANPVVVGRMFANVCVAATDVAGVEAALQQVDMVVNPETGTYFHQIFDLSVNATGGGCSMVFVTDQEDAVAMAAFETSMEQTFGAAVPTFSINVRESGGERYVRARIEVSW